MLSLHLLTLPPLQDVILCQEQRALASETMFISTLPPAIVIKSYHGNTTVTRSILVCWVIAKVNFIAFSLFVFGCVLKQYGDCMKGESV